MALEEVKKSIGLPIRLFSKLRIQQSADHRKQKVPNMKLPVNNFAPKLVIALMVTAFLAVILLIWIDEVMDLPHLLLGAESTPINWRESVFETLIIGTVGAVMSIYSYIYLNKYFLLKKQEIQIKIREKRLSDLETILTVIHHNVNNLANMFQIVRIKADKNEKIERDLVEELEKSIFSVKGEMIRLAEREDHYKADSIDIGF